MEKPTKGIAVDGGCSGNPGIGYYRRVDLSTGELVFDVVLSQKCTNNIAEYLAIAHAVAYLEKKCISTIIYTDSNTAIAWVKKGATNSSFKGEINRRVSLAKTYLATQNIQLERWETFLWGEIPADFGYKSKSSYRK